MATARPAVGGGDIFITFGGGSTLELTIDGVLLDAHGQKVFLSEDSTMIFVAGYIRNTTLVNKGTISIQKRVPNSYKLFKWFDGNSILVNSGSMTVESDANMFQFDGTLVNERNGAIKVYSNGLWCFDCRRDNSTIHNHGLFAVTQCWITPNFVNYEDGTMQLLTTASFYGNTTWSGTILYNEYGNSSLTTTWNQFSPRVPSRHLLMPSVKFVNTGGIVAYAGYFIFAANMTIPKEVNFALSGGALFSEVPTRVVLQANFSLCSTMSGPITVIPYGRVISRCGFGASITMGATLVVSKEVSLQPLNTFSVSKGGRILIEEGAVLNVSGTISTFYNADVPDVGYIENYGTIMHSNDLYNPLVIEPFLINHGIVQVSDGAWCRINGGGRIGGSLRMLNGSILRFGSPKYPANMPTWLNATILPGVDIFVQNRSSPRIWKGQFYTNFPYDVAVDRASIPIVFSSPSSSSSSSSSNHIFLNVTFATNGTVYLEGGANVSLTNLIVSDGLVASNNNRSSNSDSSSSNNNNNNNNNNSTYSQQHPSLTSLNYTYMAISANIRHAVVLRNLDIIVGHAAKITDSVVLAGGTNIIIARNASLEGFSDSDFRQPVGTSTGVISNYGKAKFHTYSYSPAVYSIMNSGLDAELDVSDSSSFFSAPIVFEDGAALSLGRLLSCSDQGSLTFLDGGRLTSTGNYPSVTNCKIAMQSGSTFSSGYGVVSLQSTNLTLQTGSTLMLGASPRLNQIFAVNQNTPSFVTIEPNVSLVINTTAPPMMGTNFTVFTTQANMSTTFSLSIVSLIFPTLVYRPYYNSTTGIYKIQLVSLGDVRPPLDLHVTSAGPSQKVSLAWVDELCPQNTTYVRDTVEVSDQQHQPYVSYTSVPSFTTKAYYRGGSKLMIRIKTTCGLVIGTNYIYNTQDSEWSAVNVTVPSENP